MKQYDCEKEPSCLKWNIKFPSAPKPSKKSFEVWTKFIEWLSNKHIETVCDFSKKASCEWRITEDRQYVLQRIDNSNDEKCCKFSSRTYGRDMHEECEKPEREWRGALMERKENGEVIVHSVMPPEFDFGESADCSPEFAAGIKSAIRESKAYAASDASMKNKQMGGYWRLMNADSKEETRNTLHHKEWDKSTIVGAEAIVLLDLLAMLEKKGRNANSGKVIAGLDNKKVCRGIVQDFKRNSEGTKDAGAEIIEMKNIVKRIKFDIEFKLVRGHSPALGLFIRNPLRWIIKDCDEKAREIRERCDEKEIATNIKFVGKCALQIKGKIVTNSIKEAIRIADASSSFEEHIREKCKHHADIVDVKARDAFQNKRVTSSMITCLRGFDHYGERDAMINKMMTTMECPLCNEKETWEHAVQCRETKSQRKEFIKDLAKELFKERGADINPDDIADMLEDIAGFLQNDVEEDDYETSQQCVGMKEIFRGIAVKDWKGADFNCAKYHKLNKIIVCHSVQYYRKCWLNRNEKSHDEEIQRKRVKEWKKNIEEQVERKEPMAVKTHVNRTKIDEERSSVDQIRRWMHGIKDMIKKVEKMPENDIRKYFS